LCAGKFFPIGEDAGIKKEIKKKGREEEMLDQRVEFDRKDVQIKKKDDGDIEVDIRFTNGGKRDTKRVISRSRALTRGEEY